MVPFRSEAEECLLHRNAEHRVQVSLRDRVQILGAAMLNFQHDLAWKLSGRLVSCVTHVLESGARLGALGHSQVGDRDRDFSATFAAFLLLLPHAHHLLAEGRHAILRHLHLLGRASAAILALRRVWVATATAANDKPPEFESLRRHAVVKLLGGNWHIHVDVIALELAFDLVLHVCPVEFFFFGVDLGFGHLVLGMVLRDLVQLRVQLSLLAFHFLVCDLNILDELDAAEAVVPAVVLIAENLVSLADLGERFRVTALVGMVTNREATELALDRSLVGVLLHVEHLVQVAFDDVFVLGGCGNLRELKLGFFPTFAGFLGNKL
mmetsp:Transcript_57669/g.160756  ORF Transcript_57669/g.160756 Transcript_57669/m.160756 type:complete len:323 (+) Transcript_57669:419-1387(+)